jgi:hypothetical protein
MPGLDPGIFFGGREKDRRDKPGDDDDVGGCVADYFP